MGEGWTTRMRFLTAAVLAIGTGNVQADDGRSELYDEIAKADAEFFAAFNVCDLEAMAATFAKDLEFYHDLAGVSGYESTMRATTENCERQLGLERELIEGSHEVYPIKDYGAIQIGRHTFCHPENGESVCGTFEFLHVWRRTEEGWKIARVISYDH